MFKPNLPLIIFCQLKLLIIEKGGLISTTLIIYLSISLSSTNSLFFFFGRILRHVGFYFSDQRLNPCFLHWATGEVPSQFLIYIFGVDFFHANSELL